LDTAGNELWRKKYISPYNSEGIFDLKMTKMTGGYFICAETGSTEFVRVILVCSKINESGDTLFWRRYPMSPGYDYYISNIKNLPSNKLVFLYYRTIYMIDTLISGAFITDTNGSVFSTTEFATTNNTYLSRIYVQNPQNIFFIGSSNHLVNYKKNIYVVKTDSSLYSPPVKVLNNVYPVPNQCSLYQNYPNPFNSITKIKFIVSKRDNYKICIYDLSGRRMVGVFMGFLEPGEYSLCINLSKYASGVYFYTLETSKILATKKLVLLK